MIDGNFALALTSGMVVTLNPCGFAMLPAYLGSFLGRRTTEDEQRSVVAGVARALKVSAAISLGFMGVFLILGVAVRLGAKAIYSVSQWLTIGIGLLLIAAGIAMLSGKRLPILTPKLERGGEDGSFRSMFVFGVSYAVASLGCSLGIFVAYSLSTAKSNGVASAVVSFVMYGLGFALIISALTVSLALAQGWFLRGLRRAMQYIDQLAAVFMLLAGVYLTWYGYNEVRDKSSAVVGRATGWSGQLQNWIQNAGTTRLALGLGTLVIVALGAVVIRNRRVRVM
jgi:cytochrome c-type biogenesis protein